ncbi:MAG: EAL domain-containing protein [Actinomycetota bacterium]|nr:EAL domain-containing protein [Actinomycetota bacterium]
MARVDERLRILLVEDDEDDYLITRELLSGQDRTQYELDWCSDYESALASICRQDHDAYLIDYRLGPSTGLDLVREGFALRPLAPVIILTGQSDHRIDLQATALGVTDYLVKQELDPLLLERSIRYAVSHQRAIQDLARSEERYALAVRATNDGIWDWDLVADRVYYSPRWHTILGRPEVSSDQQSATWFELVHPEDLARLRATIELHLDGESAHLESEHRMQHADGSWRWMLSRGLAIRRADGTATRMAGSLTDITDRRNAERQLQHEALHDGLTGLPNRALFGDRVDHQLQRGQRDAALRCAVLFLDVDRFKLVNDSLSHVAGDELLVGLARRLQAVLRPEDTVARVGGDEFTILLDSIATEDEAAAVAARVQGTLERPFQLLGRELVVTASLGIALSASTLSSAELIRNADIAMYDAKRKGRGGTVAFDQSMHRRVVARVARENELRVAIAQSLLEVHFQPILDVTTWQIRGFEALARWPAGWPAVGPLEFIPIAEETGLIGPLGEHVLRTALRALAGWRRDDLVGEDVCVSVNVSSRQLDDPLLPGQLREALAEAGLSPAALRLEITESTLMRDSERIPQLVEQVCATGVGLQLDDFGTGYSSLTALHRFPVEALKIDRSFVAAIASDDGSDAIVRSTIALAHSLGLQVIAEGIEDASQLRRLRTLGCELGQGFLLSRPMGADDVRALLAGWEHAPTPLAEPAARVRAA